MHVLTFTDVEKAINYFEANSTLTSLHRKLLRPVTAWLWTLSGDPEPEGVVGAGVHEAWFAKQRVEQVTVDDLYVRSNDPLDENQEIRVDAAIFLIQMPHPSETKSIGVFSHVPLDEASYASESDEERGYAMELLMYLSGKDEAERFIEMLQEISDKSFNVVESS